jgi:hypothetical protein
MMSTLPFRRTVRSLAITTSLTIFLGATTVLLSSVPETASAQAQTEEEIQELRETWQNRYRALLSDRARLTRNIAAAKENYARAQRRNYPRGGARQQFLIDADSAEKELAATEQEIAGIFTEARHENVPSGWLYQVEDEPIETSRPAALDESDEQDRAGRNPIYFKDDGDAKDDAP